MRTLNNLSRRHSRWIVPAILASGGSLFLVEDAQAAGFATARFGGEHGHPTTENATAIYYNPAGIAEDSPDLEEKDWHVKVFVDGTLALRWASWSHVASATDATEPAGKPAANSGEATLFNVATAPMIGATFQIENFGFGLGFFVPFGGASSWDKNEAYKDDGDFAGPYDGPQRWHTIDGTLRSLYISAAAAYDILDRVSIGASFNMVRSEVNTVRAREPSGSNSVSGEGRALIDVNGWNASFGVGVIGEVAKNKVWIGMSYQSQPGLGDMALNGTLDSNYGGNTSQDKIKLIQALPDIFRLGVRARPIKTVEMRFFGDYTNWGTFKSQCIIPEAADDCPVNEDGSTVEGTENPPLVNIVRNWGPSFGIRGGGSYWVVPEIELFLGGGYDSNAVPDSTLEPALTDFQKASLAGGLRFQVGQTFAMALSYTHLFYIERDTAGESVLPELQQPSRTPDAGGQYNQTIGVINTNIQLSF